MKPFEYFEPGQSERQQSSCPIMVRKHRYYPGGLTLSQGCRKAMFRLNMW